MIHATPDTTGAKPTFKPFTKAARFEPTDIE